MKPIIQKNLVNLNDPYTQKHMPKHEQKHFNNCKKHLVQFLSMHGGCVNTWECDKEEDLLSQEVIDCFRKGERLP